MHSSELKRDKKLLVAKELRESESMNKERLWHVKQVLSGEFIPGQTKTPKDVVEQLPEIKEGGSTFLLRCVVTLIITIIIYSGYISNAPIFIQTMEEIKKEISVDYSENLFDFIRQIPYTFEYEKINAKR